MKLIELTPNITVFESSLYRTTCTLIDLGNAVMIVDPNWLPVEIDFIYEYVMTHHQYKQPYLLFTHSDYDHIIGYGKFPQSKVISSSAFQSQPKKDAIIRQIIDFDHEYYINRSYPLVYPHTDMVIDSDKQSIKIEGIEFVFYSAQGHTDDGLFTIIPGLGVWIAGDYLSNLEMPFIDDSFTEYKKTITKCERIMDLFPEITLLIPGHGDVATTREEIIKRIKNDKKYLELLESYKKNPSPKFENAIMHHLSQYSNPTLIKAHEKNKEMMGCM